MVDSSGSILNGPDLHAGYLAGAGEGGGLCTCRSKVACHDKEYLACVF